MSATRLVSVAALVTTTVASSAVTLAAQRAPPFNHGTRIRVVLGTTPPRCSARSGTFICFRLALYPSARC